MYDTAERWAAAAGFSSPWTPWSICAVGPGSVRQPRCWAAHSQSSRCSMSTPEKAYPSRRSPLLAARGHGWSTSRCRQRDLVRSTSRYITSAQPSAPRTSSLGCNPAHDALGMPFFRGGTTMGPHAGPECSVSSCCLAASKHSCGLSDPFRDIGEKWFRYLCGAVEARADWLARSTRAWSSRPCTPRRISYCPMSDAPWETSRCSHDGRSDVQGSWRAASTSPAGLADWQVERFTHSACRR